MDFATGKRAEECSDVTAKTPAPDNKTPREPERLCNPVARKIGCAYDNNFIAHQFHQIVYIVQEIPKHIAPWTRLDGSLLPGPVFVHIEIFRNKYAPIAVIATANPATTAAHTTGFICETPVSPNRIPSTP